MLNKKQLRQLRNEIILNSLYSCDYSNDMDIKNKTVQSFFNGYVDYLSDSAKNDNFSGDIIDIIKKYDTVDNLYKYYLCFDIDPLLKDDYIAYKNACLFFGCLIYFINDYYVLSASYFMDKQNIMNISRITKNKLYYDAKKDSYYFIKMQRRQYINDFMRA